MSKTKTKATGAPPKAAAVALPVVPETELPAHKPAAPWLSPLLSVVALLAMFIPIGFYYNVVWQSAFNFPFEDDFDSPMRFINTYMSGATTSVDKLKLVFSQHNEHRIVFDRLVFLGQFFAEKTINIRTCILIGNASLLFMIALLYRVSFRSLATGYRLLALVPACYVLFTLHFWELTVWGMASLQNLYVLVFVMISLFSLTKTAGVNRFFWVACLFAVVATYTSGNGVFTFLVGAALLLFLRQNRPLLIWSALAMATAATYFWGYTSPAAHPSVYDSLVNNTGRAINYFFTLTGSVFSADQTYPARAGKFFLLLYVGLATYLIATKRLRDYLPLFTFLTFLYLTCGVLMATRSGFGVVQAFSPRYGILSVLLFASLGILWVDVLQVRALKIGAGVVFGLLSLYLFTTINDQNQAKVDDRKRLLQFASAFYNDNPQNLVVFRGTAPQEGQAVLRESLAKKTYNVPGVTLADLASKPVVVDPTQLQPASDISTDTKPFDLNGYLVFWNTWAVLSGLNSHDVRVEVMAQSPTNTYAFATGKHIRYDVANQLQSNQFVESGFSAVIKKSDLKPGQYMLWLHLTNGKNHSYLPLNQSVII